MKKLLLLLLICLSSFIMLAQDKVYAEIVGDEYLSTGKVSIKVVFGENSKQFAPMLLGDDGQKITFNTMVDAMNHLAKYGWELENTYVVVDGDYDRITTEYHWIVSRKTEYKEKRGDNNAKHN